ncbi:MAG: alpha/beta fold hydrolase [Candidatus Eiseniibacteriota bacterium]
MKRTVPRAPRARPSPGTIVTRLPVLTVPAAFLLSATVGPLAPGSGFSAPSDTGIAVTHAPLVRGHWAVTEDSVRIWYETEGEGVPIFLVPGGPGGSHHTFHLTHHVLARCGQLVYIDNRGRGSSERGHGAEPYSLENDVRDLEAVRLALGAERIAVYGRSYGGMVALGYALAHPGRVQALVVSNTLDGASSWQEYNIDGVKRFLKTHYPDRWDEIQRRRGAGLRSSDDTLATLFFPLGELYNFSPSSDSLFRAQTRPFRDPAAASHNPDVYAAMVGLDPEWVIDGTLGRVELVDRIGALELPVLVLAGRYDRITPPVVQRKISQAIPGARLVVFERSGHRPEFEEASRWSRVVTEFLSGHLSLPNEGSQ